LISKETIKTFLIYLTLGAVIVLSINTFMMVENQNRILDNQEDRGLPLTADTNQRIKNIEDILSKEVN
jgi:hypothetical protein